MGDVTVRSQRATVEARPAMREIDSCDSWTCWSSDAVGAWSTQSYPWRSAWGEERCTWVVFVGFLMLTPWDDCRLTMPSLP